jgi:short-subunit dehydrogenase
VTTALVTGATAGLGAAFARRFARERRDLVLVARDEERLKSLAERLTDQHGIEVETISADLAIEKDCGEVEARLADATRPVEILVNNAGIGLVASFMDNDVESEDRLLRLNVRAVMRLAHAVLPVMQARGHGDIVNVSSVAGFGPTNPGSTYTASKAWVTNFSESIHLALYGSGVRVMALCPGFVRTEFHRSAGINISQMPDALWLDADDVVHDALVDLRRGRPVSTPSIRYKVIGTAVRHIPRPVFNRLINGTNRRIGRSGPPPS